MRRSITVLAALTFVTSVATIPSSSPASAGAPVASPDFNSDGYADLAIGAQYENNSRGVVHVLYGSASGPSGPGSIVFGQDSAGVPGTAGPGEWFGALLAFGDVDNDGYDDLAVGTPNDKVGTQLRAGSVTLFRGSATGLLLNGQMFADDFGNAGDDRAIRDDNFGLGLAMGDYDGDGDDDIAVGIPFDDGAISFDPSGVGKVKILRSSAGSFSEASVQRLRRSTIPILIRGANIAIGYGFTVATIRGTAAADGLAVGVPGYGVLPRQPGAVVVYLGRSSSPAFRHLIRGAFGGDGFAGLSLAAGDINNDGEGDLVIGAPDNDLGRGGIEIALLGPNRDLMRTPWLITQANAGFTTANNAGDRFGTSMVIVDAGSDSYLYVGARGKDLAHRSNSGGVFVLVAHPTGGPVPARSTPIQAPNPAANGGYGFQLTALDATNDGGADVVISNDDTVNGFLFAGSVFWYDSPDGTPRYSGSVRINQDTPGVPDRAEEFDGFGSTLAFL